MVVYGDILFIINFSMDALILLGVGRLLGLKTRLRYIVLAAAVGGAYSVLALLIKRGWVNILCTVAFAHPLCFIAYPRQGVRAYLKTVLLFCASSMLLGACVGVCCSFIDSILSPVPADNITQIPLPVFLFICLLCLSLAYITGKIFHSAHSGERAEVIIEASGGRVELIMLYDSGNTLREPLSSLPVIVVNESKLSPVLPKNDGSSPPNLRLIPTKTATGEELLLGFLPDAVYIRKGSKLQKVSCIVGVCRKNTFTDIDGVLPCCFE